MVALTIHSIRTSHSLVTHSIRRWIQCPARRPAFQCCQIRSCVKLVEQNTVENTPICFTIAHVRQIRTEIKPYILNAPHSHNFISDSLRRRASIGEVLPLIQPVKVLLQLWILRLPFPLRPAQREPPKHTPNRDISQGKLVADQELATSSLSNESS